MGRPLPSIHLPMHQMIGFLPAAAVTYFITLAAVFSVLSAVIFLCGAHKGMMESVMGKEKTKTKTVRLGGDQNKKRVVEKMKSSLLMSKMISWRKVNNEDDDDDEEEEIKQVDHEDGAVWKKTIIRGGKCRPLEFSGKILYDAHGNLLPE